jgi:twitching motility protein PilT
MQTMEQALASYVKTGTISLEEGLGKSSKPDELKRLLAGSGMDGNVATATKKR